MTDTPRLSRRELFVAGAGAGATHLLGAWGSSPIFAASAGKATGRARRSSSRPNILFVFADQQRFFSQMPARYQLPGQALLMEKGVTFASHYVSATMCTSSRSVMLTGLQTVDNKMFDNVDCPYVQSLSTKIPNVGHMLRKAGYYTAYKGKWHLGREFGGHEPDKSLVTRMDEYGFADFYSPGDGMAHNLGGYLSDELIASSSISWLRSKGAALSSEKKPWSLFVSLVNPHDIMYFNADASGESSQDTGKLLMRANRAPKNKCYDADWGIPTPQTLKQSMTEPYRPSAHGEYAKAWGYALGNIPPTDRHWKRFSNFYMNSIRQVDQQVFAILSELDTLGLSDNTIVIFTADHGEMGGHHGLRGKGPFAYEEAIHVPFYVIHPDVVGGQQCRSISSHIDIVPTLLSLAGAESEKVAQWAGRELSGKDMSGAISSPKTSNVNAIRDQILFTYSGIATNDSEMIRMIAEAKTAGNDPKVAIKAAGYRPNLKNRGTLRAIFDGRYKFARYFSPTEHNSPSSLDELFKHNDVELYDLKADPRESRNLAADRAKNSELIVAMNGKLGKAVSLEMGKDDGRELPNFPGVSWELDKIDL